MQKSITLFSEILLLLYSIFICCNSADAVEVFNPEKCYRGCRSDDKCPTNAACIPLTTGSDCGFCVCNDGFEPLGTSRCRRTRTQGAKQSLITSGRSRATLNGQRTAHLSRRVNTFPIPKSETTAITKSLKTDQPLANVTPTSVLIQAPPPPVTDSIVCEDYDCDFNLQLSSSGTNQVLESKSEVGYCCSGCKSRLIHEKVLCNTPLLANSNECRGVYCLAIDMTKSLCICSFDKIGDSCTEPKSGQCSLGNGLLPPDRNILANTRFVHKVFPYQGGVMARHFASSLNECVKLCQWTGGPCRSINYGTIKESKVCELLSVSAPKNDNRLLNWLIPDSEWTYACCF